MQKISLIAQSVLELSHREKVHDNDNNNNNDDDDNDADTHPGWIIVRDGMYSVADKKKTLFFSEDQKVESVIRRFSENIFLRLFDRWVV